MQVLVRYAFSSNLLREQWPTSSAAVYLMSLALCVPHHRHNASKHV